ncbi:putative leucine-rich repeat-containing protein DDB_G0290503 isoform X2 [Tribolium castaneum]|uniref:putative leucine-rich repeat-containing protein DDB_G0290503 isoform X2 n=1 Tax=Tribolium castaneum TaxID=7070 RepID=UPI00077DD406|nr:PREDICTED: putative leucine-rich repeat-containing protein DDB_G0290503 isoform X2 [Tribolium castaneum]|eukprot:XP_015839862.1 PREDICTED: putative leucine-rich repeat-containing protein DDB_G0290503 isoform X2 [Tribolium castaneum]
MFSGCLRRPVIVKMASSEAEIASIRSELEIVQKALKIQTKRCRQLVTEYTRKLQQKDLQYQNEKALRDNQLAKVLRALIIFESRLKQEQKFISHQLKEKDYIIHKQSSEIKKLLSNQFCKNCNQFYNNTSSSPNFESLESSSEYVDYQSSIDSSSDIYATISEKSYEPESKIFTKNVNNSRKMKKFQHRKSVGSYYEVLEAQNDESSEEDKKLKISDSIPPFEGEETNNNWYASASDPDDDEHRDIYRNNPVLECMNQILLQNINDSINSPPKTPNTERKTLKKVKFEDEETKNNATLTKENVEYYETPIQKVPNFYETPQSIYSNDYEQILSKCSESFVETKPKIRKGTPPALPPKPANLTTLKYKVKKEPESVESEPDYCSISELNLPPKPVGRKINVVAEINPPLSQDVIKKLDSGGKSEPPPPENLVKKCVEKINIQLAKQTPIKKPDPEIPKLPQVSEIIIPEEEEKTDERISHDNYVKNNSQILKGKKFEPNRRPIVMGTSVSSLISGFNNQSLSEIRQKQRVEKAAFDLSQNFEEFKLDDCEIEEYSVSEEEVKSDVDLDASSIRRSLEVQKTQPTYEHFLECTGLSSKSILTPSRLLSNHKSMLKPKDIKLRSKVKANLFERHSTSTIKYWSEPYI